MLYPRSNRIHFQLFNIYIFLTINCTISATNICRSSRRSSTLIEAVDTCPSCPSCSNILMFCYFFFFWHISHKHPFRPTILQSVLPTTTTTITTIIVVTVITTSTIIRLVIKCILMRMRIICMDIFLHPPHWIIIMLIPSRFRFSIIMTLLLLLLLVHFL